MTARVTEIVSLIDMAQSAIDQARGMIRTLTEIELEELVDSATMAKMLGIQERTLYTISREDPDRIPSHKIGNAVRYSPREVFEATKRRRAQ